MKFDRPTHNPFDDPAIAGRYEKWYAAEGKDADRLEKDLLGQLLQSFPEAFTVLEVGCGTGHYTRWLAQCGLHATGLDVSRAMLDEARRRGHVGYLRGDARALPFADRSRDLVVLITTLEFLPDPRRALVEAVRVARHGVVLGVLNRWSLLALRRRLSGSALWRAARFFGVHELAALARAAAGGRVKRLWWRTTLWPVPGVGSLPLPWGGLIGLALCLRAEPVRDGAAPAG